MKKLIAILGIVGLGFLTSFGAGGTGATGQPTPSVVYASLVAGVPTPLLTNNVTVVSIQLLTSASSSFISFYDSSNTNAPYYGTNYVTSSYVSRAGYPTNYVTTYVGYNGYTNYYTNAGYWTYSTTNAASTNALAPQVSLFALSGTITKYDNGASFQAGIVGVASSNATAIVYYVPNK